MDQQKTGAFIAACRKEQHYTQAQLAEKLGITDRAVSKWETGKSMPDSSIMLELCALLRITVNELLTGERITMEDYSKAAEKNIIELRKQEEAANRLLLRLELVIGYTCTISFLILIFSASFAVENRIWAGVMATAAVLILWVGVACCMKLEREVGYYECGKCHHCYEPLWRSFVWSMHMGRTRYMKCPQCGKWSWSRKVLSK